MKGKKLLRLFSFHGSGFCFLWESFYYIFYSVAGTMWWFPLLKEDIKVYRHYKICRILFFQKKLKGWKSWRYILIFTDLEAGMRPTKVHYFFLVGTLKYHYLIRMGSRYCFLIEFSSLSSLQTNIQNILQSVFEIILSFWSFHILFTCLLRS